MLIVSNIGNEHKMYERTIEMILPAHNDAVVYEIGYHLVPSHRRFVATRSCYALHYVINGKGVFNGQKFEKGDCYLKVPNEPEEVYPDPDDPYETCWIIFYGGMVPKLLENCCIEHKNYVFKFDNTEECARLIKYYLFDKKYVNPYDEQFELHALLYRLLSQHLTTEQSNHLSGNEVTQLAAEYIEQNFYKPISVKNVADYVHFSQNYISSVFKQKYGMPIKEYLTNYRIKKASEMLKNNKEFSIGSIAESCGFNDPLYFSRVFSSQMGMSPSAYRKFFK